MKYHHYLELDRIERLVGNKTPDNGNNTEINSARAQLLLHCIEILTFQFDCFSTKGKYKPLDLEFYQLKLDLLMKRMRYKYAQDVNLKDHLNYCMSLKNRSACLSSFYGRDEDIFSQVDDW